MFRFCGAREMFEYAPGNRFICEGDDIGIHLLLVGECI